MFYEYQRNCPRKCFWKNKNETRVKRYYKSAFEQLGPELKLSTLRSVALDVARLKQKHTYREKNI